MTKKLYAKLMPKVINHQSNTTNRKGFTLLEILVAVTIVAILAAVGMVSYGQSQKVARDARRKQDLRALAIALEVYRQQYKRYPCANTPVTSNDTSWKTSQQISDSVAGCDATLPITPLDKGFINIVPVDPSKNNFVLGTAGTLGYMYRTPTISGTNCPNTSEEFYYELFTRLENVNDAESCKNKVYSQCNTNPLCNPAVPNAANDPLFVITSQY